MTAHNHVNGLAHGENPYLLQGICQYYDQYWSIFHGRISKREYNKSSRTHNVHKAMTVIPLFPLNTVLFPRMPISLHIFEDRYKLMIGRCVAERKPFGVVLLEHGTAEHQPGQEVVPYSIGCTAHITQVQQVGDGRMNIVAFGHERFQVLAFDHSQPYLMGTVEIMPFSAADLAAFAESERQLRPLIVRYVAMVSRSQDQPFDESQLPEDPVQLVYLAAALLRTGTNDKQKILGATSTSAMLDDLYTLYRKENSLLTVFNDPPHQDSGSPFSLN